MRIAVVWPNHGSISETFIQSHVDLLPAEFVVVDKPSPRVMGRATISQSIPARVLRKVGRLVRRQGWDHEVTARYHAIFARLRPDVVLAEYGPTGVKIQEACVATGIPLVVHFHGFDASMRSVLTEHAATYPKLFGVARAIVGVSAAMTSRLVELGAPEGRVHCVPCGVDPSRFRGARPETSPPVFLAVGRFVEKKAPHLTILAFERAFRDCPHARLRMIGEGPLLAACRDIARGLGLEDVVAFLGALPSEGVAAEMRRARAFVQHSVEAESGDSEGTPVAILEAGASGLPVVATRHAGIPDVVIDGETGFLVAERDVAAMAGRMRELASASSLAARLGDAARERVTTYFTLERSISNLRVVLQLACGDAARSENS